jgi:hypothetical protein
MNSPVEFSLGTFLKLTKMLYAKLSSTPFFCINHTFWSTSDSLNNEKHQT